MSCSIFFFFSFSLSPTLFFLVFFLLFFSLFDLGALWRAFLLTWIALYFSLFRSSLFCNFNSWTNKREREKKPRARGRKWMGRHPYPTDSDLQWHVSHQIRVLFLSIFLLSFHFHFFLPFSSYSSYFWAIVFVHRSGHWLTFASILCGNYSLIFSPYISF